MRDVEPGHQSAAGTQRTPCGLGNLGAEMAEEQIGEKEREREREKSKTLRLDSSQQGGRGTFLSSVTKIIHPYIKK